jgi:hypothetical protein
MPFVPFIIAILLAGGVGTAALADSATPGSALYGLDQAMERIQERFTTRAEAKAQLWARFSEERAEELAVLRGMSLEEMTEKARERWEERHQRAIDHLAASLERTNALQEEFQEKLKSAENDDQRAAFERVLENLEDVAERREARIEEAEAHEFTGIGGLPIREQVRVRREGMDPELRDEIHEQIEELGEDFLTGLGPGKGPRFGGDDEEVISRLPQPPIELMTPEARALMEQLRAANDEQRAAVAEQLRGQLAELFEDANFGAGKWQIPEPEPLNETV